MLSVWKALLLREATFRLFGTRTAWVWLLVEPLAHFAFLTFMFTVIRQRSIGGIEVSVWLILGLFGFFTFRRTANQMGGAIDSNRSMFTYRQVLPLDAILVRGFLEALIMVVALAVVMVIMALAGIDVIPDQPLVTLAAMFGLWLLGSALGLIIAVLAVLADDIRQILRMLMMPLYFVSGVIFPISAIPAQYRDSLLLNPIIHGVEATRASFSTLYHAPAGISLTYLYIWAICGLAVGLVLYRRVSGIVAAAV